MTTTAPADEKAKSRSDDPILLAAIRSVKSGDAEAFDTVMRRTEHRVAGLAWKILGDMEETRDAVQETYLRVYRFIDRYDEQREFLPWLFRITVNVCRDLGRGRKHRTDRFTPLDDVHPAPGDQQPDAVADRRERVEIVSRAISSLPEKQRLAIILRDIEGLSTREVARILGSRPSTVRVQIGNARSKIRERIRKLEGERS